jgi:hypothetical protein
LSRGNCGESRPKKPTANWCFTEFLRLLHSFAAKKISLTPAIAGRSESERTSAPILASFPPIGCLSKGMPLFAFRLIQPARVGAGVVLAALCATINLPAQELSFLPGTMSARDPSATSYSWQIDYRQDFSANLAGSIAVINEGHVPGHHRDGTAWQVWGRLPFHHDHFDVGLGAGIYYYYDTVPGPDGDSADIHGAAPIFSLSATGYLSNRWFVRLMVNRITPDHDVKVDTAALGVGYWFGRDKKPTPGKLGNPPAENGFVTASELTVFGGQSVVNTFLSENAGAYAAEYRRGWIPHLDWSASYIHEGDPEIIRRSGLALQVWPVNTFFNDRISVGVGIGPYVYLDHKHPVTKTALKLPAAVAPLASLTISARLSEHWRARLIWHRVTSNYNRDADIFLLGIGYRWSD